jgi:uncharacterized protein with von Willebrand factor type A (vWA) domain
LIQGLGVWSTRTIGGTKRIRHEYQRTLSRMTGHDYGLDATTWARWWQVAVAGGALPEAPPAERTEATFYGLRPASDRILFLIDRSGSMRERHEVRGTRFEDAVDRLLYTLRDLGPETRFGVVLFNARGHRFSAELEPADADTLERLERWATDLGPDGGTNLQSGLRAALPGLEQGELLPSAVPYDTVVVLCDGETESASWVAPWLAKYNLDARVVFHCVNIGGTPGGVLEALAGGSGGNFLSVAQD